MYILKSFILCIKLLYLRAYNERCMKKFDLHYNTDRGRKRKILKIKAIIGAVKIIVPIKNSFVKQYVLPSSASYICSQTFQEKGKDFNNETQMYHALKLFPNF